jgi:hypothetical protein
MEKGDPKDKHNIFKRTTGLPKGSNTYGSGVYRSTCLINIVKDRVKYIQSNIWKKGRVTKLSRC